jgi:GNAT superfamily N-acetyltransferase
MFRAASPFDVIEPVAGEMDLSGFDCGNPDFNEFLLEDALRDFRDNFSVTHIGRIRGEPAAYVCLVAAAYQTAAISHAATLRYPYRNLPAVKIARIATDLRFQGKGLGRGLVEYSMAIARRVRTLVGCHLLVTDALPERVNWYRDMGFELSVRANLAETRQSYPMHAVLK